MRVLSDSDIDRVPFSIIFEAVRPAYSGGLSRRDHFPAAPCRRNLARAGLCSLSAETRRFAGFRAYETFPEPALEKDDQLTAVWDRATRRLCLASRIGERLGALRTGALGGVAIDRMAPANVGKACGDWDRASGGDAADRRRFGSATFPRSRCFQEAGKKQRRLPRG